MSSSHLWLVAVALNCVGSVMVNFSANLIKAAHNCEKHPDFENNFLVNQKYDPEADSVEQGNGSVWLNSAGPKLWTLASCFASTRHKRSRNIWKTGMTFFVLGSSINFMSLGLAAQSLLAVLGGVQFISNIFFSKCLLREEITTRRLIATLIILVGLTTAVCYSSHASKSYSTAELIALYDDSYIIFIACLAAFLLCAEGVYIFYTRREEASRPLPGSKLIRPVLYSLVSATVGTQSVLQSKCLAELFISSFLSGEKSSQRSGVDLFSNWLFYAILTTFVSGLMFWLYRLNNALKLFDGVVIIPVLQVFWTTSAVLQGGIYFKEFQGFKPLQSMLFCSGIITVFMGVYLMASPSADVHPQLAVDTDVDDTTLGKHDNASDSIEEGVCSPMDPLIAKGCSKNDATGGSTGHLSPQLKSPVGNGTSSTVELTQQHISKKRSDGAAMARGVDSDAEHEMMSRDRRNSQTQNRGGINGDTSMRYLRGGSNDYADTESNRGGEAENGRDNISSTKSDVGLPAAGCTRSMLEEELEMLVATPASYLPAPVVVVGHTHTHAHLRTNTATGSNSSSQGDR